MKRGEFKLGSLYGLLGEKLKHSISPKIHSLIFKEGNIQGYYHLFEVEKENLGSAVEGLKALCAKGVNVTIPYKVSVMEYLDEISIEAKKIGSVNTICFNGNKTIGYNTDYYGFGIMLEKNNITVANKSAVILGSGGASKAVLQYILDKGIKDVKIVSRDVSKIKCTDKMKYFNLISYDEIKYLKGKDIIINCTPCGMYPNLQCSPVEKEVISDFSVAIDLIYNPSETLFLKYARELGIKGVNGLYMLVGQAVAAEELWNNISISVDKIYDKIV